MKKKLLISVTVLGAITLVTATGYFVKSNDGSLTSSTSYAAENDQVTQEQKQVIEQAFNEIQDEKQKMKNVSELLVQAEGFEIYSEQFLFYKKNVELTNNLNKTINNPNTARVETYTDTQLINEMIKKQLTAQYAKDNGITVADNEITEYLNQERNLLYDPNIEGENKALVQELMANRIKITGLTEDEYWNSKETRLEYENTIYKGKLYNKLIEEGTIKDGAEFDQFQDKLLAQHQGKYEINLSALK